MTSTETTPELLREMLAAAYSQGATDVHNEWSDRPHDADFGEAASDYAASIELPRPAPMSEVSEAMVEAGHHALMASLNKPGGWKESVRLALQAALAAVKGEG